MQCKAVVITSLGVEQNCAVNNIMHNASDFTTEFNRPLGTLADIPILTKLQGYYVLWLNNIPCTMNNVSNEIKVWSTCLMHTNN